MGDSLGLSKNPQVGTKDFRLFSLRSCVVGAKVQVSLLSLDCVKG